MSADPTSAAHSTVPDDVTTLATSLRRSLAPHRPGPRMIETYTRTVEQLAAYLADAGMPTRVADVKRKRVGAWITDLLARRAATTAHNRFRGCQAFFEWFVEEGEVPDARADRRRSIRGCFTTNDVGATPAPWRGARLLPRLPAPHRALRSPWRMGLPPASGALPLGRTINVSGRL